MTYRVDKRGIVVSPGKFEGNPEFVIHFWEQVMEGGADSEVDEENQHKFVFKITGDDAADLEGKLKMGDTLKLWENTAGFVCYEVEGRLTDTEIVTAIHGMLCGVEWKPVMLEDIANLLTNNGYPVADCAEELGPPDADDFDRYVAGDR